MTDQSFPITPPAELVQQWFKQAHESADPDNQLSYCDFIATAAAQWGADQELEACCKWIKGYFLTGSLSSNQLRAARRPKPPSLKEQALEALEQVEADFKTGSFGDTIRRALEALPND
jgi:hypothetical protein